MMILNKNVFSEDPEDSEREQIRGSGIVTLPKVAVTLGHVDYFRLSRELFVNLVEYRGAYIF